MHPTRLLLADVLHRLPPAWADDPRPAIRAARRERPEKVVVLDDDPTGTQTVHGIPVLTEWSVEALRAELANDLPACFLLSNSRSLSLAEAQALNATIGCNLQEAARDVSRRFVVVSRSDSTLRGHFPGEVEALAGALAQDFDAWLLIPFFQEGGRYTIDDVHYVAEGEWLVPAAETEFARDAVFGYQFSDLRQWVAEKTGQRIPAQTVASVSLEAIRHGGPEQVRTRLMALPHGCVCIVNAAGQRDLEVFVQGLLAAEAHGRRFLYRTAASFVPIRADIAPRQLLAPDEMAMPAAGGGLIIVGSHVPRSSGQLAALQSQPGVVSVEVQVQALLAEAQYDAEVARVTQAIEQALRRDADVVLFTSRALVTGADAASTLAIGQRVSAGLVAVVRALATRPRYLLAKGGITSSDIATQGLGVKRALVLGQILPGVPVWQLGPETRYPGLGYIVFPGNVGGPQALAEVVLAAEAQRSPVMLQLHPGALQHGGQPLVALCLAAAQAATVPVTVHLDHSTAPAAIEAALQAGVTSVMADGSHLAYEDNVTFTRTMVTLAHERQAVVEAELGRLTGTEDGLTVPEYEAKFTDPAQAADFVAQTGIDALAVCIGNVHGRYRNEPRLDFDRLATIQRTVPVPLVLHGASGLPEAVVRGSIALGVRKFNVNTEVREAYVEALRGCLQAAGAPDVLDLMRQAEVAMQVVVAAKLQLFGSVGKV